jgi:hypothetical protein
MKTLYIALVLLASATVADDAYAQATPPPAPPEVARPGYITCAIAEWCLGNDHKWTSSVRGVRGRGLRSAPPSPVPAAPFERDPNDRGD